MSSQRITQIAVVMGSCTAGGAYIPAMCTNASMAADFMTTSHQIIHPQAYIEHETQAKISRWLHRKALRPTHMLINSEKACAAQRTLHQQALQHGLSH